MNTPPHTRPGSPGTYHTRISGRVARLVALGVVVTAVALAIGGVSRIAATVAAAVVGLVVWAVLDIRIAAGPDGLELTFGPWGWPRLRVPSSQIERVAVEHANPLAFGGWGYRVRPGVRAVLVRRGPAVRLVRKDRPDLLVTTPDAQQVADALGHHEVE